MMKWINVEDELPAYGRPVLISIGETVQYITYMLDGSDDTPDWFEPYHFGSDGELTIWHNEVDKWTYLPERP